MKDWHIPFNRIVFLGVTLLLLGCSDAYKVPNQSVFEPLNARQMKRALKAPLFDEFYSDYSLDINKCKDSDKFCFADITWRNLYEYDCAINYIGKNGRRYRTYSDEREDFWTKRYGQFDSKIDSIIVQNVDSLKNYFNQFLSIEFVKYKRKLFDDIRGEVNYVFKISPVSCPVSKCQFRLFKKLGAFDPFHNDSLHFSLNTELAESSIYTWRRDYCAIDFSSFRIAEANLNECAIVITDVSLPDGEEYSVSDLALPKSVIDYYMGDLSQDEARRGLFDEVLGYPYLEYSDYMEQIKHEWLRYRFPRETAFVKSLKENR